MKWRRQGEGGRMAPGRRQEDPLGVPVGLGGRATGGGEAKHDRESVWSGDGCSAGRERERRRLCEMVKRVLT